MKENSAPSSALAAFLKACAARHKRLCPRQVLGVRMGLYAGALLGLDVPQADRRLLVIVETDGCAVDGISVATNCCVGQRTLRVEDYGKVAATFVDTHTGRALRLTPRPDCRQAAATHAPKARSSWEAQLIGYQHMLARELLLAKPVALVTPLAQIISQPGRKALCAACGEEVINGRELQVGEATLCRACALGGYCISLEVEAAAASPDPVAAALLPDL